jgi:ATP-binding protein involved in chromosome partitioning
VRRIRTYHEVEHDTRSGILEQVIAQRARLVQRLARVGAVIAVASGKGGVGKSAITANLAVALARRGARVGAVDADLNGPSLARMLGVAGARLDDAPDGVRPPVGAAGVRAVSMELLQAAADAPLRWRAPDSDGFVWQGAAETGVLREFLSDIAWDGLDYLLIDVPPGTDRIARLLDLVPDPHQVLLVTTPAAIAYAVVARSARLLRERGHAHTALVANMTALIDGDGPVRPLWTADAAAALAAETGLDVWAAVPFDPRLAAGTDAGRPITLEADGGAAARALHALAERVEHGRGGRRAP